MDTLKQDAAKQPEALVRELLDDPLHYSSYTIDECRVLQSELRRLHAENESLRSALAQQGEQQPVAWPSKITGEMEAAGQCAWMTSDGIDPCRVFWAMLAAAPAAPAAQQTEWDIRGTLAKLKCWHRLTEEEATELVTIYAGANK